MRRRRLLLYNDGGYHPSWNISFLVSSPSSSRFRGGPIPVLPSRRRQQHKSAPCEHTAVKEKKTGEKERKRCAGDPRGQVAVPTLPPHQNGRRRRQPVCLHSATVRRQQRESNIAKKKKKKDTHTHSAERRL